MNNHYIEGALAILQCLNATRGDKVLIVYTPGTEIQYRHSIEYTVEKTKLFWFDVNDTYSTGELEEEYQILQREKNIIINNLCSAAEILGCSCIISPVELCRDTEGSYVESGTLSNLSDLSRKSDILLDCTLLGLDKYIVRKHFRKQSLKEELKSSQIRGADLHSLDLESLVDGAMRENYKEMAERINYVTYLIEGKIAEVNIIGSDTNMVLPLQKGGHFTPAKGLILKGDWHFLPAGIISLCIDHREVTGRIRLSGPMWGVEGLNFQPVVMICDAGGKLTIEENNGSTHNLALQKLLNHEVGPFIGEITLGFNRWAKHLSDAPYEFYVANGNVTIALGANDHLGGQNPLQKERIRPISNVHSHALVQDCTVNATLTDGRKITLIKNGMWSDSHEIE